MDQAVIIKSETSGIHLMLNPDLPFDQLLTEIVTKFKESEKFFKNAKVAISFGGRMLSEAEENEIINVIVSNTSIQILCILDHDAIAEEVIRQKTEALLHPEPVEVEERPDPGISNIYRGSLADGQVLECSSSIMILGDIPETATVISKGNIVVIGTLSGNVQADSDDQDENAFIAATQFAPSRLMIGVRCYRKKEKNSFFSIKNRNKTPEAKIAYVSEGIINIAPLEEFTF